MAEAGRAIEALLELMARLRDPAGGCPWDREQTFATIAPYTLEEAYEVADAIDRGAPAPLREELGDLLFQIVFHARLAEERGWFDFAAVADGIRSKLVRRHPHVFAGAAIASADEQTRRWEELKAQERANRVGSTEAARGALDGIPRALPALARAAKIGRRAARVGFDWQNTAQVRDKVVEELREVDMALEENPAEAPEEIGDLLFAIANWALHLKIDPEEALRQANAKFEGRFQAMEQLIGARGARAETLSPAEWDELWRLAKQG